MQKAHKTPNPRRSACVRCTIAKAKCVLLLDQQVCERCNRLKRPCNFDDFTQPRKTKSTNSTRVEQLEAKVEALVSALAAQKHSPHSGSEPFEQPTPTTSYSARDSLPPQSVYTEHGSPRRRHSPPLRRPLTSGFDAFADPVERGLISLDEAERLLHKYRVHKQPHFPFVIIPPGMSAEDLRHKCPFLFLAIMNVCLEDRLPLQRLLLRDSKRVISKRVLEDEEKSLELLQGLLVHICWYHYHVPQSKNSFMLLQMASSMVSDMGLDRQSAQDTGLSEDEIPGQFDTVKKSRTSAEHRAFLGLYFLYPGASIFRRHCILKQTPWVMQCCNLLEARKEYPTDAKLRTYFQTQALAARVEEMCNREEENQRSSDKMLDMMIKMFHRELSDIKNSLPEFDPAENYRFTLQLKSLSMSIYELSLRKYQVEATTQSSLDPTQLWALMTSARELLEYFLKLPYPICQHLPLPSWTTIWYAFLLLTKLTGLPAGPNWDSAMVRKEVDLDGIALGARKILEEVTNGRKAAVPDDSEDIWQYFYNGVENVINMECQKQNSNEDEDDDEMSGTETELKTAPGIVPTGTDTTCPTSATTVPSTQVSTMGYYEPVGPTQNLDPQTVDAAIYAPTCIWDDAAWQRALNEMPFDNSMLGMENAFGFQMF
ncbi:hypothetical protein EJ05DRAFT_150626 [Pseudovirgaria hyperparasitica]|uniref:Zn(2)-C6 fungal-type domain-containing protein n=1 Tax=Pseudovirgaria hyperparasitica TaxID=470096 RepID=A0A6A6VWR3_9PEZI|nr:uncharacterized protein EJ05DRAFT_150626 [Pseudovirgaria hyperparasitica]KAF2754154.1 hypothetical protein EJ05DRAFT_150626 [Pseudovirgaria hyperparasitica]